MGSITHSINLVILTPSFLNGPNMLKLKPTQSKSNPLHYLLPRVGRMKENDVTGVEAYPVVLDLRRTCYCSSLPQLRFSLRRVGDCGWSPSTLWRNAVAALGSETPEATLVAAHRRLIMTTGMRGSRGVTRISSG